MERDKKLGRLVLTRKIGQSVLIGDSRVTVMRVGRNSVSLSIDAPTDLKVLRGELEAKKNV